MRNLIAILVISSCGISCCAQPLYTQKDTLRFTADSSYSRAIVRYGKELVFGTSKAGVVALNEKTGAVREIEPPQTPDEFRDVVVRGKLVYTMTSGDNGLVLFHSATDSGLVTWNPGIFFDDLAVNSNATMVLGDPVDGHFFLQLHTKDTIRKITWIPNKPNEACYAASGTTAQFLPDNRYCFVSGGPDAARFHRFNWKTMDDYSVVDLPMATGEGAGPFSVHFTGAGNGLIVGGNYTQPKEPSGTAVYTTDGGATWKKATTPPRGYRSCVTGTKKVQFACGSTGIDISYDGGNNWKAFDDGNFCALLLEKNYLYATTTKGYCIRYRL